MTTTETQERNEDRQCRSTWGGRRCVAGNGHDGIHVAADESDWIEGDTVQEIALRVDTLARNAVEYPDVLRDLPRHTEALLLALPEVPGA